MLGAANAQTAAIAGGAGIAGAGAAAAKKYHPNDARAGGTQYLYELTGGLKPPGVGKNRIGPKNNIPVNVGIAGPYKNGMSRLVTRMAEKSRALDKKGFQITGQRILDKEPDAPGSRGRIQALEHDVIKQGRQNGGLPGNPVNH